MQFLVHALLLCALGASAGEVAPGVHLLRGSFTPGSQPDGNSVVLDAPDGLIVIDTGRHAAHTDALIAMAKKRRRPIAAVINTHWHLDHVGGNVRIRKAYPAVRVYAGGGLETAMNGFLKRYREDLAKMVETTKDAQRRAAFEAEIGLIDAGAKLRPDVELKAAEKRTIAGRELQIGVESRAVTEADVWVFDAASSVLVAGDLITLPAPFLDTACPSRWASSLDGLAKVPFDVVVPGHGAPMSRAEFDRYRKSFRALLDCAASDAAGRECADGWLATARELTPDLDEAFARSMIDYYLGLLRTPGRFDDACGSGGA